MAIPFFDEEQKQSLLYRIAKGDDSEELAKIYDITVEQVIKYRYNHKTELEQIRKAHLERLLCEDLPPLDRVKKVFGDRFKTKHDRIYLDGIPITVKEAIRRANLELIQLGKKMIYYPDIVEPGNDG